MGTLYRTSFTPYLELFEPRSIYISELRLQHAWKNNLWKIFRKDEKGRNIKILSPGRHNHSDGPDFIDASMLIDGKLYGGDVEIHHRASDWYAHKHQLDPAYNRCILHVVFHQPNSMAPARCANGNILPVCYIPLEEAMKVEPPGECRIFKADREKYLELLKREGWKRVNKKVRYFYDNRLRFPNDVMLYWGLFKACGYRYNEDNMIQLFVRFPWAAYCDELLDRKDIIPMLKELAGFSEHKDQENPIRWTYSRTRPAHFPEKRVSWLGRLMTMYYRASLSGILYETCTSETKITKSTAVLFRIPDITPPGTSIQKEMLLNVVIPLLEAMRKEYRGNESLKIKLKDTIENSKISQAYGVVRTFHEKHGIPAKDAMFKNWLISQGVLNIRDNYCSQGLQLSCPICLMDVHPGIKSG
jgi:Protein of unknown function (DUF2851)